MINSFTVFYLDQSHAVDVIDESESTSDSMTPLNQ